MGDEQQQRSGGAGHLLLFPFQAQGHIIPFLNLAKRFEDLGQRGGSGQRRLEVTIVSTPRNAASLRRALPAGSSIGITELPFSPSDHGLPPAAENLEVVPLDAFPTFFPATELLRPSFDKLLAELAGREGRRNVCVVGDMFLGWTADSAELAGREGRRNVCVVGDMFLDWTAESARALGVQHRMFITSGAYGSAIIFSMWLRPPSFPRPAGPDDEQALPDFPDVRVRYADFVNVVVKEDYATDPMLAYLCRMITLHFRHSGGIVINTSEEIEPKGLRLIGKLSRQPTFAVGPIIGGRTAPDDTAPEPNQDTCIEFLDSKPQASVLFVSFGSQNSIPASEMMELARALEASGRPFIWVVRPPVEADGAEGFRAEWLPEGFEERVAAAGQGVVVRGWAPQMRILEHASTGAFLSHCGWNSFFGILALENKIWDRFFMAWSNRAMSQPPIHPESLTSSASPSPLLRDSNGGVHGIAAPSPSRRLGVAQWISADDGTVLPPRRAGLRWWRGRRTRRRGSRPANGDGEAGICADTGLSECGLDGWPRTRRSSRAWPRLPQLADGVGAAVVTAVGLRCRPEGWWRAAPPASVRDEAGPTVVHDRDPGDERQRHGGHPLRDMRGRELTT